MKTPARLALSCAALVTLLFSPRAHGGVINFGSGGSQFGIEFVEIGSPGNAADPTGSPNPPMGAVGYIFSLGKFEVSRGMIEMANAEAALGITMLDMTLLGGNGANRPATGISWFEAARFVNWLNTSQGFQAAYNFDGSGNFQLWASSEAWQLDGENLFRHKDAHYWLPSEDEWYKAAFYDPVSAAYFEFPNGKNTPPAPVVSGTADDTAVYTHSEFQGPADVTQAGGLSPFGIMGMGGNVAEWHETRFDPLFGDPRNRTIRGGFWSNLSPSLSSSSSAFALPDFEASNVGFRVVSLSSGVAAVPEPSWVVLLVAGIAGLVWFSRSGA